MRRATAPEGAVTGYKMNFYPRSPCGERPNDAINGCNPDFISIHALLAESDGGSVAGNWRPAIFLSTLSLRRATHYDNYNLHCVEISIHALLAESDQTAYFFLTGGTISIHALLAESDSRKNDRLPPTSNFYPRSPCGERLSKKYPAILGHGISIHALLAESDNILCMVRI